jgi:hypothetical protein
MKPTHSLLTLLVIALSFPLAASAQDDGTSTQAASNEQPVDNIVVVGKKSLSEMRREVYAAEEEFYSVYNDLNDDRDYNVRCYYERQTGTHIKNHICRARFVSKAYSSHASKNRNDLSRVANQDSNSALAAQTAIYQEKLETLIAANPELQAALIRYNTARADFMADREARASN